MIAAATATTVVRLVLLVGTVAASTPAPTLAAATAPSVEIKHVYVENLMMRQSSRMTRDTKNDELHSPTSKYTVHTAISPYCVDTSTSEAWVLFHAFVDILNEKDNIASVNVF